MPSDVDQVRDLTSLLLIRVRFEADSGQPMRAQVRTTGDVTAGFEQCTTVTDTEAAVTLLRQWLTDAQQRSIGR